MTVKACPPKHPISTIKSLLMRFFFVAKLSILIKESVANLFETYFKHADQTLKF